MRLTPDQQTAIRRIVTELTGPKATVRLFGSRLDDHKKGGDVDLLVELTEPADNPAWLSATLSARISRQMDGRGVDVLISAPNLIRLPIHDIARREGIML